MTPKVVVLMIGTNNITLNTADEIAAGVEAICASIHQRSASTKILLLAIFPRGQQPDATRGKVDDVNRRIAKLDNRDYVTFLDIGAKFLEPDGRISPDVMYDYLHPSAKGYGIWSAAMAPTLERLLAGRCDGRVRPASGSRTGPSASSGRRCTNRTISLVSASPPSTAMMLPTPNSGWRTRRPGL